jgi:tetratricopeptide (TPR) repeat protein
VCLAAISLLLIGSSAVVAQRPNPTLAGIVLEKTLSGKGVFSVQVKAKPPGSPTLTNSDGTFTLEFPRIPPGSSIAITLEKTDERTGEDYVVVNDVQLTTFLPFDPTRRLIFVICRKYEREDYARLFYRLKSLEAIEQTFRRQNAALAAEKEQLTLELQAAERAASSQQDELKRRLKEKDDTIAQLKLDRLQAEAAAQSVSEALADGTAGTNLERYREAMRLFLDGDIGGALKILDNEAISREADAANRQIANWQEQLKQAVDSWLLEASLLIAQLRFRDAEAIYALASSKAQSSFDANFRYAQFEQAMHAHDKAISAFDQSRKVADLNGNARGVAMALTGMGNTYADRKSYDLAAGTLMDALKAYDKLAEKESPSGSLLVGALINLGIAERHLNRGREAKEHFDRAVDIIGKLPDPQSPKNLYLSAVLALSIGNFNKDRGDISGAYSNYLASTASFETLAQSDQRSYLAEQSQAFNNLGEVQLELAPTVNVMRRNEFLSESARMLQAAANIRKDLFTAMPEAYAPDYAQTLTNMGLLNSATGQFAKARQSLTEAKTIRHELMGKAPNTYQNDYANTATILGGACGEEYIRSGRTNPQLLDEAIENLEEAVKIREPLAKGDPDKFALALGSSLNPLGMAYSEQKRWDNARSSFVKAQEAYSRIDPQRARYPAFHTLRNIGYLELKQGHSAEARRAFTTAETYVGKFSEQEKTRYRQEILEVAAILASLPKNNL